MVRVPDVRKRPARDTDHNVGGAGKGKEGSRPGERVAGYIGVMTNMFPRLRPHA